MPLILNPNFNPNDPKSQRYIFSGPTVINPMTGQMSDTLTGDLMQPAAPLKVETFTPTPIAPIPVAPAPVAPTAPVATDLISQIESLQQEALGAPTVKTAQITEATAKYEKQLNELNEQIRLHQARALERQEKALETGETLAFATGEAGRVARTDAIEAMKLSAVAQAVQGNIVLAEKLATSAADAQYSETLQKLTIARNNIINNWDTFTEDEKKRATITLESIDAQDAFAEEQKQKMVDIQKVGIKAAQLGADNVLLDKILKAKDVVEAERLLTESGLKKEYAPGDIGEFQRFFPNVDITTPTGQQQFLDWKAKMAGAGRAPAGIPGGIPGGIIEGGEINTILYNVGIPITAVSGKGQITGSKLTKLQEQGIPPADAQEIMDAIIAGDTLEEIRQEMRGLGVDPAILDTFMQTLQGKEEKEENPFR